ncbi:MAG: (2Fe-2S)-binding protein [Deltaproteobacteria bacterium]|nr:(2Fe-2S)-binding protein [Deltaproteobacteria bacterium]
MVNVNINGKDFKAAQGSNLLDICENNGIHIPHLCHKQKGSEPCGGVPSLSRESVRNARSGTGLQYEGHPRNASHYSR